MSRITLAPNASGTGTLTVAAPNTNTDCTITLPDLTGTAVVNQGSVPFSIDSLGMGVGGGTSSIFKLNTTGSIGSTESITIGTGGTYVAGSIYSDANWGMLFRAKQASPGQADFRWSNSADTEHMRIDGAGNVGIGTSSPVNKLDVNGPALFRGTGGEGGQINFNNPDNLSEGLFIDVSSVDQARFFSVRNNCVFQIGQLVGTGGRVELHSGGVLRLTIDSSGGLILAGSTAQKATGTTWSNPSDQRLKSNIIDYPKGITELMQVRVREWEYNGKGGTTVGMAGLGVIADEVMTVLPNTVDTYDAKLDEADEETTAIKKFDATEITWLLVKAVQEQQQMIQALQADIAALKGV